MVSLAFRKKSERKWSYSVVSDFVWPPTEQLTSLLQFQKANMTDESLVDNTNQTEKHKK